MKTKSLDIIDNLLKKHNMAISVVEDTKDHFYKFAIVFNTVDKKTGEDDMTEDKIKNLLLHLVDDRRL